MKANNIINTYAYKILNNLRISIICVNNNFKIVWANKKAFRNFAGSPAKITNKTCYKIRNNRNKPCKNCPIISSKKSLKPETAKIKTPDNQIYLAKAIPLYIKKSQESMIFVEINKNITKHIELKKQLINNKQKTNYYNNISHELKTPLNLIHSAAQILNNKIEDSQQKYIDIIRKNYYKILRMINNLLDITKYDLNSFNLNLKNHNISKIINNIAEQFCEVIKNKDRNFNINTANLNKNLEIACDKFKIERVLLNLLSNAVKYTDKNDLIELRAENNENNIIIKIKDTGCGIPEEKQDEIFERFKQIDENNPGSGLGLTITKSIIEMHNGSIEVDSEHEKKTEFIITFPINKITTTNNNDVDRGVDNIDLELSDLF